MGLRSRLNLLTVILVAGSAAAATGGASTKPSTADGSGEKPPPDAVVLFDGSNLHAWQPYHASREMKTVIDGDGVMTVAGGNIVTRQAFGDFRLHLEFRCPDMPPSVTGQKRGNSGVYFHDRYELQILGYQAAALPTDKECGAIYGLKRPDALATRPDDTWQAFDVVFRAPRFDATGRKTHDARATVHHNGVLIHNDVPIPKISGGGRGAEATTGPIRLQDKGHKVAFRNIWVVPLKENGRAAAAATAPASGDDDLDITLSVVPGQMKFDINRFTVRPGSTVRVTLTNVDSMPHNWLLCRGTPGEAELEVARLAWAMPDALQRGYVPPSPRVLAATKMLEPRQADTVTFRAPREPGDYPYVCTYPGHAMIMRGVMRVSTHDPVGAAPPAALQQLSYTYYEGDAWKTLPDFETLTPLADEYLPNNVISIKPRKRDDNFGFMYDAELLIRDPGRYRFFVGGHGGYRLNVDDKVLVNLPGKSKVYQIRDGALELKPGVYAFRLKYYHRSAVPPPELALACKFEGSSTSTVFSLSEDDVTDRIGRMMLQVRDEPLVVRASLPNASPRAIAVGLGGRMNYCFDAQDCFVRYGWEGDFLDTSAERGNGTGRGGEVCNVENVFSVGTSDRQPLRIGSSAGSSPQQVKFLGYQRNGKEPPSFLYRLGETHVKHTIAATPDGRSLRYTYTLDPPPTGPVFFDTKPLAPQRPGEFSVTIAREHQHAH